MSKGMALFLLEKREVIIIVEKKEEQLNIKRKNNFDYMMWLKDSYEKGRISLDEMQEKSSMKKKEIVEEHEKNHKIWKGSGKDKRWITRLPDGRRIAKKERSDLEQAIVDYYTSIKEMTVEDLYKEWMPYKEVEARTSSYINKIKSDWRTYYKTDPEFISRPIKSLTAIDLELWADNLIKKYEMNGRKFHNTAVIIKQSLKYAKKKGYINQSPYEEAEINTRLFRKEHKASSETQVYTVEEQKMMEEEMLRLYNEKPEYTAPLAIILLFYTGLRCGELVALKSSDIEGDYIHVQRQETRVFEEVDAEHSKMVGYQIVDYTKSDAGDRHVPIVPYAAELIRLILDTNEKYGWKDEDYLFVHGDKRINHGAIEGRIVDACDRLNIPRKSPHKFRKTFISQLYDNGVSLDAIRKIVGHEDERTTLRSYCFNRLTKDQTFEKVAEALEKPSVTPCDTKVVDFPLKKKSGTPA